MKNNLRNLVAVLVFLSAAPLLSACGGGGGGTPTAAADPYGDGLGDSGRTAAAVKVADTNDGSSTAIALTDSGQAYAVWSSVPGTLNWAQGTIAGTSWSPASTIPLVAPAGNNVANIVLRSNAAGNLLLGVYDNKAGAMYATRFMSGAGWDNAPVLLGPTYSYQFNSYSPDLALLSDNSLTFAATTTNNSTNGDQVYVQAPGQALNVLATLAPFESVARPFFAVTPAGGNGMLLWDKFDPLTGTSQIMAQLIAVDGGAFAPLTVATNQKLCTPSYEDSSSSLTAAISSSFYHTGLILVQGSDSSHCNLEMIRIDYSGIFIRLNQINTSGWDVFGSPRLMMDQGGNALVVWTESNNASSPSPVFKPMWSYSKQGGMWSAPQPLISNSAQTGQTVWPDSYSIAMNANGQAVGVAYTYYPLNINGGQVEPYLSVGRFDPATGWSTWTRVAAGDINGLPGVAINASGIGAALFTSHPSCQRDPKYPGTFTCPGSSPIPAAVYALKF